MYINKKKIKSNNCYLIKCPLWCLQVYAVIYWHPYVITVYNSFTPVIYRHDMRRENWLVHGRYARQALSRLKHYRTTQSNDTHKAKCSLTLFITCHGWHFSLGRISFVSLGLSWELDLSTAMSMSAIMWMIPERKYAPYMIVCLKRMVLMWSQRLS